jgi:hypothetical protein
LLSKGIVKLLKHESVNKLHDWLPLKNILVALRTQKLLLCAMNETPGDEAAAGSTSAAHKIDIKRYSPNAHCRRVWVGLISNRKD